MADAHGDSDSSSTFVLGRDKHVFVRDQAKGRCGLGLCGQVRQQRLGKLWSAKSVKKSARETNQTRAKGIAFASAARLNQAELPKCVENTESCALVHPHFSQISVRFMWADSACAMRNKTRQACSTAGTRYLSLDLVFFGVAMLSSSWRTRVLLAKQFSFYHCRTDVVKKHHDLLAPVQCLAADFKQPCRVERGVSCFSRA